MKLDNTEKGYFNKSYLISLLGIIIGAALIWYGIEMKELNPSYSSAITWIFGTVAIVFGLVGIIITFLEKKGKFD